MQLLAGTVLQRRYILACLTGNSNAILFVIVCVQQLSKRK
jgi:hypothetical protein